MQNIKSSVTIDIAKSLNNLTPKESAVVSILMLNWGERKVKQRDLVEHPYWTAYTTGNAQPETTMRELRRVIKSLRNKHRIPILHSSEGHYLPETQDEVDEFINRLEREVKRHTSSSLETYQTMKESLGATSYMLDKLDVAGVQVVSYEKV